MRIHRTSVFVDDQAKALDFYTGVLGFELKDDEPNGDARWLTVVSPDARDGVQLLLEPDQHPVVNAYKNGLAEEGVPCAAFEVDDVQAEYERLSGLNVMFTQLPNTMGTYTTAVFDDTCGNLIQLISFAGSPTT